MKYDFEKEKIVIDPRVAFQIVEHSSIISNDTLQEMWAGLFAASCHTYEEDENIFFIDILKRLTSSQVKLLNYFCEKSKKNINHKDLPKSKEDGLVTASVIKLSYDEICCIMQSKSALKVDSELNALISMGLLELLGGQAYLPANLSIKTNRYQGIRPSLIGILLYVKCQGSNDSPFEYFFSDLVANYTELLKDYIDSTANDFLEYLYQLILEGQKFENEVVYSSQSLSIENEEWRLITEDEISDRLRKFLLFSNIHGLGLSYTVNIGKTKVGDFNYKLGFSKTIT